ncbi:alcohol dehydrogenase catalytic domain-containing protein [Dactylosporangium sp. NPDC000521]|uniref:alcohol dehydrogenase catalytic domain-containing protein n=1 Tax=Dactylosporangium sp. NPDC000521 TaxID=3363975 RepID=UPI00369DEF02
MRATLIYGAGDVRIEDVPDPSLREPTDAIVRVVRSCICGSDLWPYAPREATQQGDRIGHEFLGVVEEAGRDVSGLKAGDLVVAPFVWADNTCDFCREGLQTSCRHGGDGTHTVLECVGLKPAIETAFAVVRNGGTVSRVGAPQYRDVPADFGVFFRNITLTGGVAPARAYIEELLPDVLAGRVEPGKVFDRTVGLDQVPDGYRAMADRSALKVLIQP